MIRLAVGPRGTSAEIVAQLRASGARPPSAEWCRQYDAAIGGLNAAIAAGSAPHPRVFAAFCDLFNLSKPGSDQPRLPLLALSIAQRPRDEQHVHGRQAAAGAMLQHTQLCRCGECSMP